MGTADRGDWLDSVPNEWMGARYGYWMALVVTLAFAGLGAL